MTQITIDFAALELCAARKNVKAKYMVKYYQSNRTERIEYQAGYDAAHKEQKNARFRKAYQRNPEKYRQIKRASRARLKAAKEAGLTQQKGSVL